MTVATFPRLVLFPCYDFHLTAIPASWSTKLLLGAEAMCKHLIVYIAYTNPVCFEFAESLSFLSEFHSGRGLCCTVVASTELHMSASSIICAMPFILSSVHSKDENKGTTTKSVAVATQDAASCPDDPDVLVTLFPSCCSY